MQLLTLFPYTTLFRSILAKTSVSQIYFEDDLTTEDTEKNKKSKNKFCLFVCCSVSSVVKSSAVALLCSHYGGIMQRNFPVEVDRKSTRLNSSHLGISYAVTHTLSLHDALPIYFG